MDFNKIINKHANLEKAKKLIKENTLKSLQYACLELRLYIETLCYEKLILFKDEVSPDVFKKWHPKRIIKFMLEYDVNYDKDIILNIINQKGDAVFAGKHKALTITFLNKHYHKLGYYLHIPPIADKNKKHIRLKTYLEELIKKLETYKFNMNGEISKKVEFDCIYCKQVIVKRADYLDQRAQTDIQCPNEKCNAHFIVKREGDKYNIYPKEFHIKCLNCNKEIIIPYHKLKNLEINEIKCKNCNEEYFIFKDWVIKQKNNFNPVG